LGPGESACQGEWLTIRALKGYPKFLLKDRASAFRVDRPDYSQVMVIYRHGTLRQSKVTDECELSTEYKGTRP
jgi:hypothetical protein